MKLVGRVVVITGAGSGIGRAMALRFASEGARVVAADRNGPGVEETAALVQAAGGEAVASTVDVAQPAEVHALVEETIIRWGRLDILCNNAAIMSSASTAGRTPGPIRSRRCAWTWRP